MWLAAVLNLNGVNAKEHAVFRELARVKAYFEKIKEAESGGAQNKPNAKLDGAAANRFIKHALAGNERHDRERAARQAAEKANAKEKLEELRTNQLANAKDSSKKRKRASASKQDKDTAISPPDAEERPQAPEGASQPETVDDETRIERKKAKKEKREKDKTSGDSRVSHKTRQKSSKPPKDSKAAFDDLLKRREAAGPQG